jgi:hypothetical protein
MIENTSKHLVKSYLAVFVLAAALYIASCAPASLWQDSAMLQYRIWHNDIEGGLGLAQAHPLYCIIAIAIKYIPLGEFGYRINLISSIAAAFTVANIFLLLKLWLGKNTPAVLTAITLALSHTLWQQASIAEDYTLYTALLTAELLFMLQYFKSGRIGYLYLLGLFNGLAIATHLLGIIPLTCYVVLLATLIVRKQINIKNIALIVLLWLVGASPYEYLIVKNIITTGDLTATLASAVFGSGWQQSVLNTSLPSKIIKENLILIAYNFSTFNGLFFFAGLYALKKLSPTRSFKNILLALLVLFFVFAFRYTVPDRYVFFLPFYCVGSVVGGAGFGLFITQPKRKILRGIVFVLALLPVPTYIIAPAIAQEVQFKLPLKRNIPYRNDYIWFLRPWKTADRSPERFANEALKIVEDSAVICADGTTVYPLWYLQEIKGIRTDVKVVSQSGSYKNPIPFPTVDTIEQLMADTAVYVVSPVEGYCPGFLLEHYDFVRTGPIYRVVDRQ